VPRAVRLPSGQFIINPGSVGLQAYVDLEPERYVMELATSDAQYAIVERRADGWRSAQYAVPYDHLSMVRLAKARGRAQWEAALLRAYVQ
jgi:hypothetical protein